MTSYENITYAVADHIATITFNRPDKYNALNTDMLTEIASALKTAGRDKDVYVIVMTGEGKAFCSGQDLGGSVEFSFMEHLRTYYSPADFTHASVGKTDCCSHQWCGSRGRVGIGIGMRFTCDVQCSNIGICIVFTHCPYSRCWSDLSFATFAGHS